MNPILARFAMTLRTETKIEGRLYPPLSDEEKRNFQRSVEESLAQIRSTDIGSSLLDDIERASNEVLIFQAAPVVGNKCRQKDASIKACRAACYEEVLDFPSLADKVSKQGKGHPAMRKLYKFCVPEASGGEQGAYRHTASARPLPLAHKKPGEQRASEEAASPFKVSSLQRGLIGYHIMDHLTPGAGTGADVLWDPTSDGVCRDLPADKRAAWMDRPPWIALVHELIHAWRLVTGRCVFEPGGIEEYWEEAMTVGLPPYDGCRYTENRFRQAKALPLRTFYGETTLGRSKAAAAKHGAAESRLLIKVVGSGPNDPLVFDFDIRSAQKPDEVTHGTTDTRGRATAGATDGEIRFRGFGAFGRVETQWQKILVGRQMTLQFGRYSFICEPLVKS
ncbi:M91 family zinc metallopeptidase [Paraburkholderia sp. A2WS-5]|uniref:M91 family zinc metallopeptidase n=1 Tax=unclassified Paraburkholderia TaxID=2615204 RepID=UPI003B77CC09